MSIAILASGTLLKIGGAASSATLTTIPECKKIKAPNIKFDLKDTTSHDNANSFRTWLPGLADGETCTADINFVPTNAIHTQIRTQQYAFTADYFELIFPNPGAGSSITFDSYVQSFTQEADVGELLTAVATLKITGAPIWV